MLSDYNNAIYENYTKYIYQNPNLKYDLVGINDTDNSNNTKDTLINCNLSLRFMEPNPFQIAIFIWVVGFVWQEFKQVFGSGIRVYLTAHSKYSKIQ
jgi:hypothetical protein